MTMKMTRSGVIRAVRSRIALRAQRTAFLARFIVLRESRRSRAHRKIEELEWTDETSARDLAESMLRIFQDNGDRPSMVERDIQRALSHAERLPFSLYQEYSARSTLSFVEALSDYERSNTLLFTEEEGPRLVGWQPPGVIRRVLDRQVRQTA